jgi:hypothetical protein
MDWKYSRFGRQQAFAQSREAVLAAARAAVAETSGWSVVDTAGGFEANGHSGFHLASATFAVAPSVDGATLTVDLKVERAGSFGFILVDVGGYYDGQISHWIEDIRRRLDYPDAGSAASPAGRAGHARVFDTAVLILVGILAFAFILNFVVFPLIGLFTGDLYFISRGGDGRPFHGPWARAASVALLVFDGFIVWRIWRMNRSRVSR